MKRQFVMLCIIVFLPIVLSAQKSTFPVLKGEYLGQNPPGVTPEPFAPGFICTELSEGCSGWGKNMEYFIFQRWLDTRVYLYITSHVNGTWSNPEVIPIVDKYQVRDFTIAPDGKTLVFVSNLPIAEIGSEGEDGNIWLMEKTEAGWTEPKQIGKPINTKYHDSYPSLAANKNLYFFSRKPGGFGESDIYFSEYVNGRYQEPVNLGGDLNTKYHEWDTYIAQDESYIIYCSMMPGGQGEDDLYISFRQENGSWGRPIHMGNEINSDKSENRPYVSPDGKYLFYTSNVRGNRDIYWVDTRVFESLRKKSFN